MGTENLKNLSPAEHLRRLKEIEQQKKKEIEEAQRLLSDTIQEIEEEEKKKETIPIPQVAATDEAILFTVEEKEVFRLRRFKETQTKGGSVTTTTSVEQQQEHPEGLEDLVVQNKPSEEAKRQAQAPQYNTQTKQPVEAQQQKYHNAVKQDEESLDSKYTGMYQRAALEEEKFKVPMEKGDVLHQAEKYLKGQKAKTTREAVEEVIKYTK